MCPVPIKNPLPWLYLIRFAYTSSWCLTVIGDSSPMSMAEVFVTSFEKCKFAQCILPAQLLLPKVHFFLCNSESKLFSVIKYVWAEGKWNIDIHCYYGGSVIYRDGVNNNLFWGYSGINQNNNFCYLVTAINTAMDWCDWCALLNIYLYKLYIYIFV